MRAPEKIRVLLVEDHLQVRQGLRKILDDDPRIEVVEEVGDAETAIEAASRLKPTVVVLDIGLPGMNGIEATSRILKRRNDVAVLSFFRANQFHGGSFVQLEREIEEE